MPITLYIRDIVNFPGISKTETLDIANLIVSGSDGDEKICMSAATTAYSDYSLRTAIQNTYANYTKQGFSKSSGFVSGPYTITAMSNDNLIVEIDGIESSITLTPGVGLTGSAIAADIENKLIACAEDGGAQEGNLSFLAANCSYTDSLFKITSGSLSDQYTGANKSSVSVVATGTVNVTLGYDLPIESEALAGRTIKETYLSSGFTTGSGTLYLADVTQMEALRAYMITDGTNTDYFIALTVSSGSNQITIPYAGVNGFDAITHSYSAGTGSKVQQLTFNDPDPEPKSPLEDVDAVARHLIYTIQRQIDFSA
jgi:hypothetical protein